MGNRIMLNGKEFGGSETDTRNKVITYTSRDTKTPTAYEDTDLLVSGETHKTFAQKVSGMFQNVRYLFNNSIVPRGTTTESDFDNITTPGTYWVNTAVTQTHAPAANVYGMLDVTVSGNQLMQRFVVSGTNLTYFRIYNGSWNDWKGGVDVAGLVTNQNDITVASQKAVDAVQLNPNLDVGGEPTLAKSIASLNSHFAVETIQIDFSNTKTDFAYTGLYFTVDRYSSAIISITSGWNNGYPVALGISNSNTGFEPIVKTNDSSQSIVNLFYIISIGNVQQTIYIWQKHQKNNGLTIISGNILYFK